MKTIFPEIISRHPKADVPVEAVNSFLVQANKQQFIFMEFDAAAEIPPHSHEAQWGIVIDGEMEITINGETKRLIKGDTYFVKKDEVHSVKIKKGYKDLTLFDQETRYKPVNK